MNLTYFTDLSNRKLNDRFRPFSQKLLIKNLLKLQSETMDLEKNEKNNHVISSDNIPLFYIQQQLLHNQTLFTTSEQKLNHIDPSQLRKVVLKGLSSSQNYLIL